MEGGRWPVSVVLVPPRGVASRLDELMRGLLGCVGEGHLLTGRDDAVHITVRALETHRAAASPDDERTPPWIDSLRRAVIGVPPLRFALTGLTLTNGSVMAQVEPLDTWPWVFMQRLGDELGSHGCFEKQGARRNIWYANLLHFAGPIADPEALIASVEAHRDIDGAEFAIEAPSWCASGTPGPGASSSSAWRPGQRRGSWIKGG